MNSTKSDNYLKVLVLLAGLLVLMLLGSIVYFLRERSATKKEALVKQKQAHKLVMWDLWTSYDLFKSGAETWNSQYAKLTLNHTRTSVEHKKYTVEEFAKKHRAILFTANQLATNVYSTNRFRIDEVSELYPKSYEFQNMAGTFRLRDEFYASIDLLDEAFNTIINNSKKTDSVPTSDTRNKPKYLRYFRILDSMDEIYYDLVSHRYEQDLTFVIEPYPDFKEEAINRVFGEQNSQLLDAHNALKNPDEFFPSSEKAKQCSAAMIDSLTTYALHNSGRSTLIMIRTDQILSVENEKSEIDFVTAVIACAKENDGILGNPDVVILATPERYSYFKSDTSEENEELLIATDESTFRDYYRDSPDGYWIRGSYDLFPIWYPNESKRIATPVQEK